MQRVGAWAAKAGLRVGQIRHSGKLRAEQTAEILAAHLHPPEGIVAVAGLAPLDDVQPVGDALAEEKDAVMLVGHLPFVSRLAGLLVNGDPERGPVRFRMGGIVCLSDQDGWAIEWAVTPELAV